jgi:3,4-dihydroxy 2-butanone 4-phosphate synthase/GTP cyclohydrolase II
MSSPFNPGENKRMNTQKLAPIEQALQDLQQGKMIILVDDESRENEGDLVMAAEKITPTDINFMTRYGRGLVCLPMLAADFDRLEIPMMAKRNRSPHQTAFGVSIEAAHGVTTGISAFDRSHTIKVAIDEHSGPEDVIMPGHIFPLKAQAGGVLVRAGHTEGSVDLCRLAGLKPAAIICEILSEDGNMARGLQLHQFAQQHQLTVVSIHDLITYRYRHEVLVEAISASSLPIQDRGRFAIKTFRHLIDGSEHVALIAKNTDLTKPCLVRLHSECLTGDVFGSTRCDCGKQLNIALEEIAAKGGVLLYLRQEGRGIGLANKIKAYALQEAGLDTVQANHQLGFVADARDYGLAAQILRHLQLQQIRLLTNNPDKISSLARYGIVVTERVALETVPTGDNIRYLRTKKEKLGHLLTLDDEHHHEKNATY